MQHALKGRESALSRARWVRVAEHTHMHAKDINLLPQEGMDAQHGFAEQGTCGLLVGHEASVNLLSHV